VTKEMPEEFFIGYEPDTLNLFVFVDPDNCKIPYARYVRSDLIEEKDALLMECQRRLKFCLSEFKAEETALTNPPDGYLNSISKTEQTLSKLNEHLNKGE
jgi:hypothetical protein